MQFKREEDLVGVKKERDFLLEWVKDNDRRNMIASVLGMGGIGKTTLVAHIYSAVKEDFDTCAWITVSQRYEVDDLLRQIVREFRKNDRRKDFPENVDVTDYRSLPDIGHVHLAYNPSYSACFFSRNSIFLSQKISQQCFSAGL
jgi:disease resistance protein RPM1